MRTSISNRKGFSLSEALVALGVGGVFLTSVFAMWTTTTQVWRQQSAETKLHYSIETSLERIKHDLRLSDGNSILFYPQNAAEYTAISMPSPVVDANGFQSFAAGGGIQWSRTLIYHVFTPDGGKPELRLTVIPSFESSAALRQSELDAVVTAGAGTGGATTRTLFSAETVSLVMRPEAPSFDGYAATTERSENITFGTVHMTPGSHSIRFEVTGKNDLSTGRKIGLDQITVAPSGAPLEAEALPVSASSGQGQMVVDMSAFGANVWGGNNQLQYQSAVDGDYLTFQYYYDQWLESNFSDMTFANTGVINTDPALSLLSREGQAQSAAWQGAAQAQSAPQADYNNYSDRTVRTVIKRSDITKSSVMIRLKFTASSTQALQINSAYFGPRNGNGPNFTATPTTLYFDNATVLEGAVDGVGAVGAGTATGKLVPAGEHVWTNWFTYAIDLTQATPDYLVSFNIPNTNLYGMVGWQDTPNTHSYQVIGDFANSTQDLTDNVNVIIMPNFLQTNDFVLGCSEMSAWTNVGEATSQVYDTQMTAPSYGSIAWSSTLSNGSSVLMKVRSSSDQNMVGATAWTAIAGGVSSPMSLSGLANQRYVQFQATLTAGSPYTSYPEMDNVVVTWPGSNALVDISGYITRRPDYGMFKVTVDGQDVVNALSVDLDATEKVRSKDYAYALTAQVKPKNSGK